MFSRLGLQGNITTQDWIGVKQLFEDEWYVVSAIENIVMFIPFGVLAVRAAPKLHSWISCLLVICVLSSAIEMIQYILLIGESQILDICMNCAGALLGYFCFYPEER